jgi:predicted CXXCH cytochrome family protein
MKLSSTPGTGRALRALPLELLVVLSVLLTYSAPAPAPVDRATSVQALVAASAASGSGGVVVEHHVLAELPAPGAAAVYQKEDAPLPDVAKYQVLRVRFRVHNTGDAPATITPRLEYRAAGSTASFAVVPEKDVAGAPLHTRREWVRSQTGAAGTVLGPSSSDLPVGELLMPDDSTPVAGHRSGHDNPDRPLTLPAGGATEEELSIAVSGRADDATSYELRLTDAGATLGDDVAIVGVAKDDPAPLSAGQRTGVRQAAPPPADERQSGGVRYRLTAQSVAFSPLATTTPVTGIHGPYSQTADQCAVCHRAHTATGPNLLTEAAPQANLCLTCHDGTGAPQNVKADYTGATANNPADRAYYQHDALTDVTHTLASEQEFAGVSNRHSTCTDCHNPHQAKGTDSTQTASGWTPSGRLSGVSGVAVTNGAAGTAPSYTFLNGTGAPVTQEYQLCLKCHSGYTVLPSNSGFTPTRYVLDKGVELNPNNGSYHPVEAAGTNGTAKMAASLSGTSPYKLWNFDVSSTIRCTQCHASNAARSPAPAAGANLPLHTSTNRGILLAPYRDRILKPATQGYAAADFALCLLCHAETPFATETTTATNYFYHGKHLTRLQGMGSGGTDIDTPGAGQGNAVCAECHFRIHSPQTLVGTESLQGSRLVSFAPDVTGLGGPGTQPAWAPINATSGSCTLTCHGFDHDGESYS